MARLTKLLCCVLLTPGAAASSESPSQGACASTPQVVTKRDEELEVWVDLSVPPLSTLRRQNGEARAALRARIQEQQNEVMSQLVALGAKENARIVEVRNAIAVRIPSAALAQARTLPGVVKVRPVKHRQRAQRCSS